MARKYSLSDKMLAFRLRQTKQPKKRYRYNRMAKRRGWIGEQVPKFQPRKTKKTRLVKTEPKKTRKIEIVTPTREQNLAQAQRLAKQSTDLETGIKKGITKTGYEFGLGLGEEVARRKFTELVQEVQTKPELTKQIVDDLMGKGKLAHHVTYDIEAYNENNAKIVDMQTITGLTYQELIEMLREGTLEIGDNFNYDLWKEMVNKHYNKIGKAMKHNEALSKGQKISAIKVTMGWRS